MNYLLQYFHPSHYPEGMLGLVDKYQVLANTFAMLPPTPESETVLRKLLESLEAAKRSHLYKTEAQVQVLKEMEEEAIGYEINGADTLITRTGPNKSPQRQKTEDFVQYIFDTYHGRQYGCLTKDIILKHVYRIVNGYLKEPLPEEAPLIARVIKPYLTF